MTTLTTGLVVALVAICLLSQAQAASWDRCLEPQKVGPGKAAIRRWFYDASQAKCVEFSWGGGAPNGNNFESKAECRAACSKVPVCELPPAPGSGDIACEAYIPRLFFNSTSGQCEQFIYGGCGGNGNNFETVELCNAKCKPPAKPKRCQLAPEAGSCLAYFQRWYYDEAAGDCKTFVWGGCQGNANRFLSRAGCRRICKAPAKAKRF